VTAAGRCRPACLLQSRLQCFQWPQTLSRRPRAMATATGPHAPGSGSAVIGESSLAAGMARGAPWDKSAANWSSWRRLWSKQAGLQGRRLQSASWYSACSATAQRCAFCSSISLLQGLAGTARSRPDSRRSGSPEHAAGHGDHRDNPELCVVPDPWGVAEDGHGRTVRVLRE